MTRNGEREVVEEQGVAEVGARVPAVEAQVRQQVSRKQASGRVVARRVAAGGDGRQEQQRRAQVVEEDEEDGGQADERRRRGRGAASTRLDGDRPGRPGEADMAAASLVRRHGRWRRDSLASETLPATMEVLEPPRRRARTRARRPGRRGRVSTAARAGAAGRGCGARGGAASSRRAQPVPALPPPPPTGAPPPSTSPRLLGARGQAQERRHAHRARVLRDQRGGTAPPSARSSAARSRTRARQ